MNSSNLIDKLKSKVLETNEYITSTDSRQQHLLMTASELNTNLRNYIEKDVREKKILTESTEKMNRIKSRVDSCKQNIQIIKDKLKTLKLKYFN